MSQYSKKTVTIRKIWKHGDSKAISIDSDYFKQHNPDYLEQICFNDGVILLLPVHYPLEKKDRVITVIKEV